MGFLRGFHRNLGGACLLAASMLGACDDDKAADHEHGDEHGHGAGTAAPHDHSKPVGPETGATCPSAGTQLTYDNFGKDFMTEYCLGCHSESKTGTARNKAPADHNFDKLADIQLLAAHIDQNAGSGPKSTNRDMPRGDGPKPSDEERAKLSEWLACGAD